MDSKSLLHATAGAMRASGAKPLAAELRSPRYSPGMTDPASKIVCRGRDLAEDNAELAAINDQLRSLIDVKQSPLVIEPLSRLVVEPLSRLFGENRGCDVSIVLSKLELSEPVISVTIRITTLRSTIPERLMDDVSGCLKGLRFALTHSPDGRKEYVIGLAEEEGIRGSVLPELLSNLAKVVDLTIKEISKERRSYW